MRKEHADSPRLLAGDLIIDKSRRAVSRGSANIKLPRLSYKLLLALVEVSPEVLTQDDLIERVWGGRVTTPETITQRVKLLRRALGDDAAQPRYIGLVRGEGYRFLADVEVLPPADAAPPRGLLAELARRRVPQLAVVYAGIAWVITELLAFLLDALPGLPAWSNSLVTMLFIVGFPVMMLLAWRFDIGPRGIQRRAAAAEESRIVLDSALVLGWFVIAAVIWSQFNPDADGARSTATSSADKSVAVLPFVDMSPTGDQVYFGDGIAEELINELTHLEGLRVASRSSSFAFRDKAMDSRSIGEALNVSTILEGSVRKDGNRIRVTAQLINTADGYHLWSKTFDRELEDIFAIQGEIAGAVGGALGVTLGVGTVNAFFGAGTTNVEAYETYLRALNTPLFTSSAERIRLFERAVALDEEYAAAWAALGLSVIATVWISPVEDAAEIHDRGIPILNKAIELAPDSSDAYTLLAVATGGLFDWTGSEARFRKAMEIDTDGQVLGHYSNLLMRTGRSWESLRYAQLAGSADRRQWHPAIRFNSALAVGQFEELRETGVWVIGSAPQTTKLLLALNEGDLHAARITLLELPDNDIAASRLFRPVLNNHDSREEALATLESIYADSDAEWPAKHHDVALLAAFLGDPAFALDAIAYEVRHTAARYGALWYPVMSEVRKLPGFKQLVTDVNLVKYWRSYGWPDHCRPIGTEDFECF